MIKNYIFDFGNVLGEFYPEQFTAHFVEDEEVRKMVSDVVFDRLYWDKLDDGSITDEEVKNGIRGRLCGELGEIGCKVYDSWVKNLTPVPGMQKLIEDLRKTDIRLYLLSNISKGFAESYHEVLWIKELFARFDGLVFSGVVEKIKPNRDIFEYLLKTFDLNAHECLFVDDNPGNIKAAETVGINAYLFDGDAENLRTYLGL